MASSSSSSDLKGEDTSYVEMYDPNDATLIGKHCQDDYCNQLDFLPFLCQSCGKTYCLDHRSETAHKCANAGAWAKRKRLAQQARSSIGGSKTLRDKVSEKPCSTPNCKTIVGTSLTPGVHCSTCNRDYCLKHRLQEDHNCKNLVPIGARPNQMDLVGQRAMSALDRLKAWGKTQKEQAGRSLPKPKPSSTSARLIAVNNLKKTAKGDAKVPVEKRVYLYVEAEAETAKAKFPKGEFFYSKDWVVGRVLDAAAKDLQVQNINNQSSDERDKLRVFHVEGGRLLDYSEKVGVALQSGNTVVLLRGVGAPVDLIEMRWWWEHESSIAYTLLPYFREFLEMPPLVSRKRLRGSATDDEAAGASSSREQQTTSTQQPKTSGSTQRKSTLYDDLDAAITPQQPSLLRGLEADDDGSSSLSSMSDTEFEDVPAVKRQRTDVSGDDDDEDEDVEFEDVAALVAEPADAPVTSGDLELTLSRDDRMSLTNTYGDKKGPSKRERSVRYATHRLHVLLLLWHNSIRNSWLCDPEVQATVISHLPPRLWDEVDRWMRSSGLAKERSPEPAPPSLRSSSKNKGRVKGKASEAKEDSSRDWSSAAVRLEEGVPDMSRGDPLIRLMQSLTAWWRQRFKVTTPGLRKRGYMPLERLDRLTKGHKNMEHNADIFGEKISSVEDMRRCARSCRGSRDVGAQLFTALVRGLGIEARLVANLQTLGFGWNKLEDAEPETQREKDRLSGEATPLASQKTESIPTRTTTKQRKNSSALMSSPKSTRKATGTGPIVLDESDELDVEYKDTDDESVVEMEARPKRIAAAAKQYDTDLEFPHYWTEVLSPITQKYLPVDPIVKNVVATNRELVEKLEPRGGKADKARQMMGYVVGYSSDGTAKDVTVRYLKKQIFPGRTKASRMPVEKVPVYNRYGKVKRYEQLDWFKAAMSGYQRGSRKAPITEVDEVEDSTDLKPAQPEKKEVKEGEETLQYYKQSKEFVLERHLKREEGLRAGAEVVKIFRNKVRGGKVEEQNVYLRSDVLQVKSAETWHKQGRAPIQGEEPLKRVPYRAATTNRRREIMEAEAATGNKVLQGLYSFEQTDWIIPPPIKDGIIPKNEYGNIDLFAQHMCPQGAAHVPFRGAVKVCKRLQIDYAEAVVDFEFGHRMAVPVIQGVVIPEEHHDRVMEELQKDEAERVRKEDEKRKKAALGQWRRFLMGMRIVKRIREDYGDIDESVSVFAHSKGGAPGGRSGGGALPTATNDEDLAGGFLPEGYEEEEEDDGQGAAHGAYHMSGFFATAAVGDDEAQDDDGLVMEDHGNSNGHHREQPVQEKDDAKQPEVPKERPRKPAPPKKATPKKAAPKRGSRKKAVIEDSEEENE
ncbi:xeroderma pigmentosum group C-complementing protein [Geosmithia morbida]|uniref:Xeroderma pigmentosum group C-complementing protein n=1 Tax=Geosmithia morbida TaxID=1094350 RepID=A0A9P4Z3D2_9HYPO|nr:xeroderma pigmentosum group C-complementing protein [Geosmithia morbida]KAF4126493.1 xeroderma pigmentosum group C-complementing protein [Geosmithia morbida]